MKARQTTVLWSIFVFLGGMPVLPLWGESGLIVKLRFYEGLRSIVPEPQPVVTSSYLRPLVSASIPSGFSPEEEKKQIKKVFNLIDVRLLTEADLSWELRVLKPPRLLKKVDPVYPEIARQARVEGIVILEAETDIYGNIVRVQLLRSIPLLDQAAMDAVRQRKYEPMTIDGKPKGLIFTVTVVFRLTDKKD